MLTEPNEDERLLAWACRRSLATAETNARRLRQKNAMVLRLTIEQSEWEAAAEAARLTKLKRKEDKAVRRMKGLIVMSSFDYDDGNADSSTSYSEDQDPTLAADTYNYAGDRKGKSPNDLLDDV